MSLGSIVCQEARRFVPPTIRNRVEIRTREGQTRVDLETELLKSRQILRKARSLRKTGSSAETKTKGPAML